MNANNPVPSLYLSWIKTYDNSTTLSARAVFLLWTLSQLTKDQRCFPIFFPAQHGNLVPTKKDDCTITRLIALEYLEIVTDGKEFLTVTDKGIDFMKKNKAQFDKLDLMLKEIDANP